jgi:hypothetical protein
MKHNRLFQIALLIFAMILSACGALAPAATPDMSEAYKNIAATQAAMDATSEAIKIDQSVNATVQAMGPAQLTQPPIDSQSMTVGALQTQAAQMSASTPNAPSASTNGYTPNWSGLDPTCPTVDQVLKQHGITKDMLINNDVVPMKAVSWEPCLVTIEFKPQYYGTTIPLINGDAYDTAPVNDDVTLFWGGDPNVTSVKLQWGTSFRWGPAYQATKEGKWLDPNNAIDWATRSVRFGRYWHLPGLGLPQTPYFGRLSPYRVKTGNLDVGGWIPPSLDAVEPRDWRDATAMLGGLPNPSEWTTDGVNFAWKYHAKVAGNSNYCPAGDPCWQTVYIPQASNGYVELWANGGPQKFYAMDLTKLMSGQYNVDEFSYHPFNNH